MSKSRRRTLVHACILGVLAGLAGCHSASSGSSDADLKKQWHGHKPPDGFLQEMQRKAASAQSGANRPAAGK